MCETIMEAVSLTKHFRSADKTWFTAVDGASISLQKGKTLGLLGQSGSGKSTLGQMMVGLLKPDSGELFFHGKLLSYPIRGQARRRIQILFQHPEVSFNPQLTLIEPFGLHAEHLARYPGELSGGELQRAALARVTVLEPEMILLDEPTSMLDVITQAQMIDFLRRYQQQHQTAYLFITHSTALAEQFCDEIVKMEDGRLGTLEAPPQTPVGT